MPGEMIIGKEGEEIADIELADGAEEVTDEQLIAMIDQETEVPDEPAEAPPTLAQPGQPEETPASPATTDPPKEDPAVTEAKIRDIAAATIERERKAAEERRERERLEERARRADELEEQFSKDDIFRLAAKQRGMTVEELILEMNQKYIQGGGKLDDPKTSESKDPKVAELERQIEQMRKEQEEAKAHSLRTATHAQVQKIAMDPAEEFPHLAAAPEMMDLVTGEILSHYQATGKPVDPRVFLQKFEADLAEQVKQILGNERVRAKYGLAPQSASKQPPSQPDPSAALGLTNRDASQVAERKSLEDMDEDELMALAERQLQG